jgi:hypothetical protein
MANQPKRKSTAKPIASQNIAWFPVHMLRARLAIALGSPVPPPPATGARAVMTIYGYGHSENSEARWRVNPEVMGTPSVGGGKV